MALQSAQATRQPSGGLDFCEDGGGVCSRRIEQSIVARPRRRSMFSDTKTKIDRLRARIALAVKPSPAKKKRGQRNNYSIPAPSRTFSDDELSDAFDELPPALNFESHQQRRWSSFEPNSPEHYSQSELSFASEPWGGVSNPSSAPPRRSTGSLFSIGHRRMPSLSFNSIQSRRQSRDDNSPPGTSPCSSSSSSSEPRVASDKWDAVRGSIQESHKQPLPYGIVKPSERSLNRKVKYIKNKWTCSHGGNSKRLGGPALKTHYQEPWWRKALRSTINWMCPFVYVGKQGDVYCTGSL